MNTTTGHHCSISTGSPLKTLRRAGFVAALTVAACGGGAPQAGQPHESVVPKATPVDSKARAAVDASDREDADRKLDSGRKPVEMLTFFGIKPGMKVAELGAGTGYTSELLARLVGPSGVVYGQNNAWILEKFAEKGWTERLAKPINKNIVRVNREFDDPFPPEARDLDAVFVVLFYHDVYWFGVDRAKMNAAVLKALKPGGTYAIIDHSGRPGSGSTEVKTLHRIEEVTLREDVLQAGFKLAAEADFLRNSTDTRDWNAAPMAAAERRGTSDRFVLKFVKPQRPAITSGAADGGRGAGTSAIASTSVRQAVALGDNSGSRPGTPKPDWSTE